MPEPITVYPSPIFFSIAPSLSSRFTVLALLKSSILLLSSLLRVSPLFSSVLTLLVSTDEVDTVVSSALVESPGTSVDVPIFALLL